MNKKHHFDFRYIGLWFSTFILVSCLALDDSKLIPISSPSNDTHVLERACPKFEISIKSQYTSTDSIKVSTNKLSGLVVYTSVVQDIPQVFLRNLDTNDVVQLTNSGNNSNANWSPDGAQITFLKHTKEGLGDIYIMDKDGRNQQPLIATNADENDVSWSPDGKKIAFASNQTGSSQIYVMDMKSKEIIRLTDAITYAAFPAWTSDGKRISFQSGDGGEAGRTQIFIMNADGSNVMQVTDYDVYTFDGKSAWCPDDSCLVFSRDAGGGAKLMLLDVIDKSVKPLFGNTFAADAMQTSLSRSPSRCYLTFVVDREYFAFDMYNKDLYPLGIVDALSLSLYP